MAVYAALVFTMLFWGISFVASKFLLFSLTPITYMAVRFSLATVILGAIALRIKANRLTRYDHLLVFLTALAEPIAYFLFESYGLTKTTASKASLIIATIPAMVMIAARIFLHEPLSRRGLSSITLSVLGIAMIVGGDPNVVWSQPGSYAGDLLILGAVVSAAVYITFGRFLNQRHSPVTITLLQIAWGAAVFSTLWFFQTPSQRVVRLGFSGWGAMLFLVIGATIGAFLLYNFALSRVPAAAAALFIHAIPVVTAIAGWILLDERLSAIQIAGGGCVIAAVAWNSVPQRRQPVATARR